MAQQWFYEKDGYEYGPLTPQQLQSLARSGKIEPEDLVWREGMQTKIPAAKYKGLLSEESVPQSQSAEAPGGVVIDTGSEGQSRARRSPSSDRLDAGAIFSLGFKSQSFVYQNWISVIFLTMVFILACASSSGLIISLPLVPIFMMGYMKNLAHIRARQGIHWEGFVSFLRRGWPALFNVFELGAVFILITAIVIFFLLVGGVGVGFVTILGQALSSTANVILLIVIGSPIALLGLALGLGAAIAYWAIVYSAQEDDAGEEVSIYSRLELGLQAISNNKATLFKAGACITLFVVAYGLVLFLTWFVIFTVGGELPFSRSGFMLRKLLVICGAAFTCVFGGTGLATLFAYHVFVAESIIEHFRSDRG